ncbi:MAG: hypothetical protein MSIBF_06355 [Candidatus Altiarchaeales archaeon IMC4]|nr:MAG: hypothetical protein MSIBF_06355 [Candidatus Altiarchaeales archaeon IMC4]
MRKAIYKEFQETIEIVADLSAMVIKDSNRVVEDDYSNLEKLAKVLDCEDMLEDLKAANGLRNVLVHQYNGVIDRQAYDSINSLLPSIKGFTATIERWIKKG